MLTISNGWASNSISYATIIQSAKDGHQHALDHVDEHAPELELGERMVDYVFCGSVKSQLISHVYNMSRNRTTLEMLRKDNHTDSEGWNDSRMKAYQHLMKRGEEQIKGLLSGNSLKFGPPPFQHDAYREDYLIFRDRFRCTSIGLPLKLQDPEKRLSLQNSTVSFIPSFDRVERIEMRDLANIKTTGKLRCGRQTYDVRFADNDKPILMQIAEDPRAELIQRKLLNLWVIGNVKKRLIKFRSQPVETTLRCAPTFLSGEWISDISFPSSARWGKFTAVIQKKISRAVDYQNASQDSESRLLEKELDRYLKLISPTAADIEDFKSLRKKITRLEAGRSETRQNVQYINEQLEAMCKISNCEAESVLVEAIKSRMLNFTNLMCDYFVSKPSKDRTDRFTLLCQTLVQWNSQFSADQFRDLLTPPKIKSWDCPLHPPQFKESQQPLLAMLQDPAVSWEQFDAAMTKLKTVQDARITARDAQYKLGHALDLDIQLWCLVRYPVQQPRPEVFSCVINSIEKIRDELLTPGNEFTDQEIAARVIRYSKLFSVITFEYERLHPVNLAT